LDDLDGWTDEADVVVVGLGAAGVCAAIEASASGGDVLALERAGAAGGTSALSGGIIYLGGGTPIQEACGFPDDPDTMATFLLAACGPGADEAKVRRYCDDSVAHYHWLVDHGVPFKAEFCPEPNREPVTDAALLYSGGEDTWPFRELATPAPRGHCPQFPDTAGGFLMGRLLDALAATTTRVHRRAGGRPSSTTTAGSPVWSLASRAVTSRCGRAAAWCSPAVASSSTRPWWPSTAPTPCGPIRPGAWAPTTTTGASSASARAPAPTSCA
jgi:hypothetical protein